MLRTTACFGARLLVALAPVLAPAASAGDFNGDGYADLVIGVPTEGVAAIDATGAVHVLYGSAAGPATAGAEYITQPDIPNGSGNGLGDHFGRTIAVGDFDGDDYDDLAIGATGEEVGGIDFAGSVTVLYGSASGLQMTGALVLSQNAPGVKEKVEAEDQINVLDPEWERFGIALVAADFDGDGFADLAVGVNERFGKKFGCGAVHAFYGSADGLGVAGNQLWHQNRPGMRDKAEAEDHFGSALAAGDFNGDGRADLAISVPGETFGKGDAAVSGAVAIVFGSAKGLKSKGNRLIRWSDLGVTHETDEAEEITALAAGDFDLDSRDDLAIGAAMAAATAGLAGGAVFVVYSREDGFDYDSVQAWGQFPSGLGGIGGIGADGDEFGASLATGDFDDDLIPDLAIGVPGDTAGSTADSGTFMILFGEFQVGLGSTDSQLIHQDSGSVPGTAETGDHFGDAFAVGDFDGDSVVDLAVGAPGKDVNGESSAGSAFVLFGVGSTGIGTATGLSFDQETPGIAGAAGSFESFGSALGS